MDVLSHAVAGAASGAIFGRPLLGAVFGVLPDVVLGIRRKSAPNSAYNMTHSLGFLIILAPLCVVFETWVPILAVLSHIVLDLPTHGTRWAPTLLYPISKSRFSFGKEWEWFSRSWWIGLALTIIWSGTCLNITYS